MTNNVYFPFKIYIGLPLYLYNISFPLVIFTVCWRVILFLSVFYYLVIEVSRLSFINGYMLTHVSLLYKVFTSIPVKICFTLLHNTYPNVNP